MPTANQLRYNKATFWENKTVKNILKNEVYIGNTVQNKRSRISYKNRKIKSNPQEQWNIVENTHEPIIDKQVFNKVQKMVIVQRYNRNEKKHKFLLDGLLVCYECKHKIGVRGKKNGYMFMICNNYRRNSKLGLCTSHGFSYDALEEKILQYIKNIFLAINSKKIELNIKNNRTKQDYGKMLKQKQIEINLIKDNIDQMYVDKLNNKISEEMYERLFDKLINEVKQKEKEYDELKMQKEDNRQDNSKEIEKIVKEFLKVEKPTPEIMKVIINKIEIHQDKQVDIYFNFKKLNDLKDKLS
ncbi:MAG: recombinase family protein [Clostridia bacterium]